MLGVSGARRGWTSVIAVFALLAFVLMVGTTAAMAATAGSTEKISDGSRVADPDTMVDYENRLLTEENGSRYAGRVWTDKTVFAYDDGNGYTSKHFDGNKTITMNMETDGYAGSVDFNSDFAHVYSALASLQVVNGYPPSPVDLVIVFDMSGSMGQDTRYGIDTGINTYTAHNPENDTEKTADGQPIQWPTNGVPMADRNAHPRIQTTLNAINEIIDSLMAQNPQNRVSVCGYGANATVLMPLGHYKRAQNEQGEDLPYLIVGGMETLYHPSDLVYRDNVESPEWYWMNNRDTCYTVVVNAQQNNYTGVLDKDGSGKSKGEQYSWKSLIGQSVIMHWIVMEKLSKHSLV